MNPERKISSDEAKEVEDWRNEHGLPDFQYLQSLVIDGTVESTEKLRSIAEDINTDYEIDASGEELVQAIRSATERNEDEGTVVTT